MRRSILNVAALAFALLGFTVITEWPESVPKQQFSLDAPERDESYSSGQRDPMVLQTALVSWIPGSVAILDHDSTVLEVGRSFEVELAFRTPTTPAPRRLLPQGRSSQGRSSQRGSRSVHYQQRPLPEGFGEQAVNLTIEGRYLGQRDGRHGVYVRRCEGERSQRDGFSGSHGSFGFAADDLLLDSGQAAVWMKETGSSAVLLRLAPLRDAVRFRSGNRADWIDAFVGAVDVRPEALREHAFSGIVDGTASEFEPVVYGSVGQLLAAGYVLDDDAAVAEAVERLRVDGLLDRVLEASRRRWVRRGRVVHEEREEDARHVISKALVTGVAPAVGGGYRILMQLKLLGVTRDAALAESLCQDLHKRTNDSTLTRPALKMESFGSCEAAQTGYRSLRSAVIARMGWPWSWALQSGWRLLIWVLLAPAIALLFVLLVRPTTQRLPLAFPPTTTAMVMLAVLSFVTVGRFSLRTLLLPVWWGIAYSYLRGPLSRGIAVRSLVWLALTVMTIDALVRVQWFVMYDVLQQIANPGLLLCWCMIGLHLHQEGRWLRLNRFVAFLGGMVALSALGLMVPEQSHSPLALFGLVVLILLFLNFLAGGRDEHRVSPAVITA